MSVDVVKTIIEAMEKYPDKWLLVKASGRLTWARMSLDITTTINVVDVKIDGSVEIGVKKKDEDKADYGRVPVGYWERRRLKAAISTLFREKTTRIIDRALLDSPEKPAS